MQYLPLGRSGLMISRYVLGTLTFAGTKGFEPMGSNGPAEARRLCDIAFEAGVNAIDTANLYSYGETEKVVAEAIAGRREDVVLASKVRFPIGPGLNDGGASRSHIMDQIDRSLARLKTDYLDLYWVHQWDGLTPVEETVAAMSDLVRMGKIRYWGVSNYSGWQLAKTVMLARESGFVAPVAHQFNYTPEAREAEYELIPAGDDFGVAGQIWSPLGEGMLSGKIDRDTPPAAGTRQGNGWPEPHIIDRERLWRVIDVLKEVAGEIGASVPQVVLAWLQARAGVHSLVIGARTEAQLRDNLAATGIVLSSEQAERIEAAGRPAAIYPLWHRAMAGMDRPTPIERPFLEGYRARFGHD